MVRLLINLLVLAAVAALGLAVWWQLGARREAPVAVPTPPAAATMTPTAVDEAHLQYRLAGVAVGDVGSYAVIADPSGSTSLYRPDDDIPGLGRLTRIEEGRAFVAGKRGEIELSVRPAPTATRVLRSPTPARKRPSSTTPSPAPDGTARG